MINGRLGNKQTFTVSFNSNGGTEVPSQVVEDGRKVTRPENPIRVGYTFEGWYINGDEKWVFGGYDVTENIQLAAHWNANKYDVIFDAGLGELDSYTATYTYDSSALLPVPVLEDNYFMGWYYGSNLVESGTWKIASNVTLTAHFIQEKYNVYYDYGYSGLSEVRYASYGQAYEPLAPTRTGYTFEGWYDTDNHLYSGDTIWSRESDLNLTALWSANTYTILLDLNGGSLEDPQSFNVIYDQSFTLPIPSSSDGPFNGWYLDGVKLTDKWGDSINPFQEISNVTLEAIFYIQIANADELMDVSEDLGASYRLLDDIDISSVEWSPLGSVFTPFTGIFDGQGYTISGLTISNPHDYVGLFGYNNGKIMNLSLDDVSINVTGAIQQVIYGGILVGYNAGTIENITTLSGSSYLKIRGGVNGYIGGIIGYNYSTSELKKLANQSLIFGDSTTGTGGLIGYNDNRIIISESFNSGDVSGTSIYVGGFIGYSSSITIGNSFNSGNVSGTYNIGGFVGSGGLTTSHSYNSGNVSGTYNIGGFVGYSSNTTISHSYNNGDVSGTSYIGGFVGDGGSITITISNSFNSGNVSGTSIYVGGFIGYSSSITIGNSFNSGNVSGTSYIGGFVGGSSYTTISNSYNNGDVSGTSYIGGFIGYSSRSITISNSFNSGDISGNEYVGGFVGKTEALYVYYSVNFGNVTAAADTTYVGGILGNQILAVDEEEVYFTGRVTSNGLEVDGIAFGTKATDLSMFDEEFFTNVLGWSDEIWDLSTIDISNGVYPVLREQE